jgi:hypothetical protein
LRVFATSFRASAIQFSVSAIPFPVFAISSFDLQLVFAPRPSALSAFHPGFSSALRRPIPRGHLSDRLKKSSPPGNAGLNFPRRPFHTSGETPISISNVIVYISQPSVVPLLDDCQGFFFDFGLPAPRNPLHPLQTIHPR